MRILIMLLRGVRKHASQRAVAKQPMVGKSRRGVKCGDDNKRVGQHFVNFFDNLRELVILGPGRRDFENAKHWQSIAVSKLPNYPSANDRREQPIKKPMSVPACMVGPSTKGRDF